jgi:hypothetical protein
MERSGPESFRGKIVTTRSELAFHPEEQRREAKVDRPLPWHAVAFGEGGEDDVNAAAAKPLTILPRIPKGTLAAEPADASSTRTDHCMRDHHQARDVAASSDVQ